MGRITTDNPKNSEFPNYLTLMNFCTAKNGRAVLCYADGKENVDLAEYTACKCQLHGKTCGNEMCADMTADEVMDGDKPFCGHRDMNTKGLDYWCGYGKKRGKENA